jgi:hypothetical protein
MRRVMVLVLAFCAAVSAVTQSRRARADEIAPELETLELRQKAQAEARKLVSGLDANDQRRLTGLYVAFDSNASDPSAMVACDDDGDYVIVITDAMLRLVSLVARAQSYDEANGSRSTEDYAGFVARSQIPGRRLLPPPPGFYTAQKAGTTQDTRLRESLAFVLARELTHFRAGDLVCAHPTATHESGDDEWTAGEQRRALENAATVYPGRPLERDTEATVRTLDAGRTEQGALGFLRFFEQLELERTKHASRFFPTYLAQHPSAVTRAGAVKVAARNRVSSASN